VLYFGEVSQKVATDPDEHLLSECSRLVCDLFPVDSSHQSSISVQNGNILSNTTLFESYRRDFPSSFSDAIVSRLSLLEGGIEQLRAVIEKRITNIESRLDQDLPLLHSNCDEFRRDIKELKQIPVLFGLNEADPLQGILDNLTWKHGGNLQEKGIISITSKSGEESELKRLFDLRSESSFRSADERDQWVCWDLGDKFIRLTHYTIKASNSDYPKSWVVEGSTDNENWIEIDRRKNDSHLKKPLAVQWFDVRHSVECHFVRLSESCFRLRRTNHLMESLRILRRNTVEMFTRKELSRLHQSPKAI
jgi:hypothetical protein